jgi:hypothetical protein
MRLETYELPALGEYVHDPRTDAPSARISQASSKWRPLLGALAPVEEVAVGTEITLRPPHRTRRALLTHRAPTLDGDEEPLLRPRMQDAWEWQVPISDRLHSGPR